MQLIRQFNSLKFVQQNGSGGYELSFGIFNPKKCYMVSTCFNCVLCWFTSVNFCAVLIFLFLVCVVCSAFFLAFLEAKESMVY